MTVAITQSYALTITHTKHFAQMMEIKFFETMRGILTAEPTMLTPAMKMPLKKIS